MRKLILMLQFFTRIPLNFEVKMKEGDFARGLVWFPVTGLFIGIWDAGFFLIFLWLLKGFQGSEAGIWLASVMGVAAHCLITGAMQLDGFADSCDGLYSARTRERMLEIMKDSRTGTFGAVGIVFDLLLRIGLLAALAVHTGPAAAGLTALTAPVAAKSVNGLILSISGDARAGGGMGSLFIGKVSRGQGAFCLAAGMILVLGLFGIAGMAGFKFVGFAGARAYEVAVLACIGLACFVPAILANLLFKNSVERKLGGMTGDTLGAASEIAEIVFTFAFLVLGGMPL